MNEIVLTFDVDWAPDFMIEYVVDKLAGLRIKSTWFVTHDSPATRALAHNDYVEVGIHPNFAPESTQGDGVDDVLTNLLELVPHARSVRTHGLVQSHAIMEALCEHGLDIDSSIYLPGQHGVEPFEVAYGDRGEKRLLRMPFVWTESIEFSKPAPFRCYHLSKRPGLEVYDFHPVHMYLNSCRMCEYRALQCLYNISDWSRENVELFVNRQGGALSMLNTVLDGIRKQGGSKTLSDIASEWQRSG